MKRLIIALAIATAGQAHAGETQIETAKALLERTLVDPASVQYRDVKDVPGAGVCGQFNARNSYGGYAGFMGFAWRAGETSIATDEYYLGPNVRDDRMARAHAFEDLGCPSELDILLRIERQRAAGK